MSSKKMLSTRRNKNSLRNVTAAILAGGLGSRLRPVLADRPKVLAPVRGRPYLTYLLDRLAAVSIRRVVLLTGYLADQVRLTVGDRYRGMRLIHSVEPTPLGTGGALRQALSHLASPQVLILNGDSWCDVNLENFHAQHFRRGARLSMVLSACVDSSRFGQVRLAEDGRVLHFAEKTETGGGWINAGVYLLERGLIAEIPENAAIALERELVPAWLARGDRIHGYCSPGRFIDIGTPQSYAEAASFFHGPVHA
jgi:D-glycero-alpha-D-manno-heptose 1-phosphate guanylyltransferase